VKAIQNAAPAVASFISEFPFNDSFFGAFANPRRTQIYTVKEIQGAMAEQPLNHIEENPGHWAFPIES
jgi:hypothetical protein